MILNRIYKKGAIVFLCLAFFSNSSFAQQSPLLHHNEDSSKIQFAIISDLWGGNRPGIFEDAIEKINLLQPQFVMSVGDLIDGKTLDASILHQQWHTFNSVKNQLSMPFYYVAGNHDISNAWMEEQWKKMYGNPYYYFICKNVLFLIINTQDSGRSNISDKQVAYFKNVIHSNPAVRWTFIFMHRPVWQTEKKDPQYQKIENFLNGRNYTVFSGHHHTYVNLKKNGNKHFVLGSTGGGSDLRGEKYGEFDHITMVTLAKDTPHIVNLKLDGIIKEDVVNEKTFALTQTLINGNWLQINPDTLWAGKQQKFNIVLQNANNYPLKVKGRLSAEAVQFIPDSINQVVPAKERLVVPVSFKYTSIERKNILLKLLGAYVVDSEIYSIPAQKQITILSNK